MIEYVRRISCASVCASCAAPVLAAALIVAVALASSRAAAEAAAPQESKTAPGIWDGIFTDAQAERGMAVFEAHCATCHDADQLGEAPTLTADAFLRNWEGHSVGRLYTKILEMMPPNNTESVNPTQKLEVLTFILRENGFPSGASDLKAKAETLARIQIVPQGGPAPLRTGAIVRVVGCLTSAPANSWVLTRSTEPTATTLDAQTPADLKVAETQSLGTQIVRLVSLFPSPETHQGHRVEVKGLLVRNETDVAINVVMLRSVASACQ